MTQHTVVAAAAASCDPSDLLESCAPPVPAPCHRVCGSVLAWMVWIARLWGHPRGFPSCFSLRRFGLGVAGGTMGLLSAVLPSARFAIRGRSGLGGGAGWVGWSPLGHPTMLFRPVFAFAAPHYVLRVEACASCAPRHPPPRVEVRAHSALGGAAGRCGKMGGTHPRRLLGPVFCIGCSTLAAHGGTVDFLCAAPPASSFSCP